MSLFTPASLAYLRAHHGVASRAALAETGLSDHAVRRLVDAGNLQPVLRGVYRMPVAALDLHARCAAVCAAHPDLAIASVTAGRIWGLRRVPRDPRIHVLAPPASHPTIAEWVIPYRTSAVHARDVVVRPDGIAVTSRPRTAFDLTRSVGPGDLLSIIEQVIADGGHGSDEMRRVAVDWLSPGRPWVRRYLRVLDRRLPGGAAESHLETVLGDALVAAGVRGIERQFWIDLPGYGPARFDLALPAIRLAIEVDGFPTHRETDGRHRDASRDAAARLLDWSVTRVEDRHVTRELPTTVAAIRELVSVMSLGAHVSRRNSSRRAGGSA